MTRRRVPLIWTCTTCGVPFEAYSRDEAEDKHWRLVQSPFSGLSGHEPTLECPDAETRD